MENYKKPEIIKTGNVNLEGIVVTKQNPYNNYSKEQIQAIIDAYDEYVKLLSDALTGNSGFLYAHGIKASQEDVEKGIKCREKIKALTDKL